MAEKFFLLDAHSYIYQSYFAIRGLTSPSGDPVNAVYGFARLLHKLLGDYDPDYLAIAADPPGKVFRHDFFPEYKATRKPMPEDLAYQIPLVFELFKYHDIPLLIEDGYEADDVLASAAKLVANYGYNAVIVTTDKDVEQVIGDNISVLHIHKNKEVLLDRSALIDKLGIKPDQVIDMMALSGDSSDNIPGVPGIGPKTAVKLLCEYHNIENVYANIESINSNSLRKKLLKHRDNVEISRKLVTVVDDLSLDLDFEASKVSSKPSEKLLNFYEALGFRSLAQRRESFSLSGEPQNKQLNKRDKNAAATQGNLFESNNSSSLVKNNYQSFDDSQVNYDLIDTLGQLEKLIEKMYENESFAVDLETTSLDPHTAEIVGIAVSMEPYSGYYIAMKAPSECDTCPINEGLALLKEIFENPAIKKVGQNLKYDISVLKAYGVGLKGILCDTMIASYLLNPADRSHSLNSLAEKYLNYSPIPIDELIGKEKDRGMEQVPLDDVVKYACEDADLAWRLYLELYPKLKHLAVDKVFRDIECPLLNVLADMEFTGINVDLKYLGELSKELESDLASLQNEIYCKAGKEFNINSPQQLSQVLFEDLELPAPKGKKKNTGYSTEHKVLENLSDDYDIAKDLLKWRQLSKLKSTYADALVDIVNPVTGRLHTSFNQTGTATGRLSSSAPNLQNIPVRTAIGRRIRHAFIPSKADMSLLSGDYSQVELRVLAHCSGDEALQQAFIEDRDIHTFVAAQVYGVKESEVTGDMRAKAKAVNFGIIYGQTAYGLSKALKISNDEAQDFIDEYFSRYPQIKEFVKETIAHAAETGCVKTLSGRRRPVTGLNKKGVLKNAAERIAVNTVVQGSAADLIKIAMINIHKKIEDVSPASRLLVQIHDELLFEVPDHDLGMVKEFARSEMQNAMDLNVPLKVDFATGKNWEEAK